jgi:hypothetical protein
MTEAPITAKLIRQLRSYAVCNSEYDVNMNKSVNPRNLECFPIVPKIRNRQSPQVLLLPKNPFSYSVFCLAKDQAPHVQHPAHLCRGRRPLLRRDPAGTGNPDEARHRRK